MFDKKKILSEASVYLSVNDLSKLKIILCLKYFQT